jgi:hypothetical protein
MQVLAGQKMRLNAVLQIIYTILLFSPLVNGVGSLCHAKEAVETTFLAVFPGAEGFGSRTHAGRGGKIIRVVNWNDSGPGSFRAAVETAGPRIVVFEVGGTIELRSNIVLKKPYITIAGQTAPSPGIQIKGAGISIETHDVLLQHIFLRVGDEISGPNPNSRDNLQVVGSNAYNVVIDHVSAQWATDENMSTNISAHDVTFSNCLIAEGLKDSIRTDGEQHSNGSLFGEGSRNISVISNLYAHNRTRSPGFVKGNVSIAFVNNLAFNSGTKTFASFGGKAGPSVGAMVGNLFIAGPETPDKSIGFNVNGSAITGTKIYQRDNVHLGGIPFSISRSITFEVLSVQPVFIDGITVLPSTAVETHVLANAGARPGLRFTAEGDFVDERIVREVSSRSGIIPNCVQADGSPRCSKNAGGWPQLTPTKRVFLIPPQPHEDEDHDGYTNIEEILHQMAKEVEGDIHRISSENSTPPPVHIQRK